MSRRKKSKHTVFFQERGSTLSYNDAREQGRAGVCGEFALYSEAFALKAQMDEMFPHLRHWIVTTDM